MDHNSRFKKPEFSTREDQAALLLKTGFLPVSMFARALLQCYNAPLVGAWRSLVARFNGVEEVVGSNPAAPTNMQRETPCMDTRRFLLLTGVWRKFYSVKCRGGHGAGTGA